MCGMVVNAPIFAKGKSEKIKPEQLNVRKKTSKINNLAASDEVCCSLKVLQSDLIPFLRRKRRGIKPSARINIPKKENLQIEKLQTAKYTTLLSGHYLQNFFSPQIITDKNKFNSLYQSLRKSSEGAVPEIDFNTHAVVFAPAGRFPTGGFSINFVGIKKAEGFCTFVFVVNSPAPDAVVTMAFTSPYILVDVELAEEELLLVKENKASVSIIGKSTRYNPELQTSQHYELAPLKVQSQKKMKQP